ncbi:MAG: SigB/SigF/SigG family RNA polymerase sigma factor [Lachnospiraceae bacterium]|nr:SigB/SigF/SigG family RNA polymerase sigma factor [Lachnospiraceae bacterium]
MSETRNLLAKTKEGDREARNTLIEENLRLVHHVVKRFVGRGVEMQDLFQIGTIGLIKAVDHFDLDREVQFSTYAVPMIMGEIKRFLRDDGMVKVSRSLKENAYRIRREQEQFCKQYGREPLITELSKRLELTPYEIVEALEASSEVESLQKEVYRQDGSSITLAEQLPDNRNEKEELLNHMVLKQLLTELEPREREIIVLRYMDNLTQTEVAERLNTSQVQISRYEKKILKKMKLSIDIKV